MTAQDDLQSQAMEVIARAEQYKALLESLLAESRAIKHVLINMSDMVPRSQILGPAVHTSHVLGGEYATELNALDFIIEKMEQFLGVV